MARRADRGLFRPASRQDDDAFGSIIDAARVGAEWALTVLYREWHPALVRYLRGPAPGVEEDLAAEVWIEAARGLVRFEGDRDGFRRWLFTIARRRAIDSARNRDRRKTDMTTPAALNALATETGDPAAVTEAALMGDDAVALIASVLPAPQADVVLLRVVGGLSVTDVAEIVGRSPSAVSVLQHRALRRLARHLANDHGHLVRKNS